MMRRALKAPARFLPELIALILLAFAAAPGVQATADLNWPGDPDLWRDIAQAQTFADGDWLADPQYLGESIWYNPLAPSIVAVVGRVTQQPIPLLYTRLGAYLNLLAPLGLYLLVAVLIDRWAAVSALGAFLFLAPATHEPAWALGTYSPWLFAANFAQSWLYLTLAAYVIALRRRTYRWWALVGGLLGVTFLAHTAPAVIAGGIIALTMVPTCRSSTAAGTRTRERRSVLMACGAIIIAALIVSAPLTLSIVGRYGLRVLNPAPTSWAYEPLTLRNFEAFIQDNFINRAGYMLVVGIGLIALLLGLTPGPSPDDDTVVVRRGEIVAPPFLKSVFDFRRGGRGVRPSSNPIALWRDRYTPRSLIVFWLIITLTFLAYHYVRQLVKREGVILPAIVPGFHFLFYFRVAQSMLLGAGVMALGAAAANFAASVASCLRGKSYPLSLTPGPSPENEKQFSGEGRRPLPLSRNHLFDFGRGGRGVRLSRGLSLMILAGMLIAAYPAYLNSDDLTGQRIDAGQVSRDTDRIAAYQWMRANTQPHDVFLAGDAVGTFVISPAGRKLIAGDSVFVSPYVDWAARNADREALWAALEARNEAACRALMEKYQAVYVAVSGNRLARLAADVPPFVERVFTSETVHLYRLRQL